MTEPKHKASERDQDHQVVETAPDENAAVAEDQSSALTQAEQVAKSAQAEIEQLKDQVLRALAEAENTRRRAQKELDETRKYAVSNFAKEMLNVADNFRRALEAIPKDDSSNEALKHLVTGVEATERQLLSSMDRFGIKKMEALGRPFDPNFHRVMIEQEDSAHPAGTIIKILQDGYMIHERLLREAMVVVTKGGTTAHKVDTEA